MCGWLYKSVENHETREFRFDYSPAVTRPGTSVYLWSLVPVGPAASSISCCNWDQGLSCVSIRTIGRTVHMLTDCHLDKGASDEPSRPWTLKDQSPSGCSLEDQGSPNTWDQRRHRLAVSRSRFFLDVESEESSPNHASSPAQREISYCLHTKLHIR